MKIVGTDLHFIMIGIVTIDQNFQGTLSPVCLLSKNKVIDKREVHLQCHVTNFNVSWRGDVSGP